jgi:uncharacterized integral membrane protein (TIGR00697 family)
MPRTRREIVFFILGGFFLTNAILAELTGGKLFVAPTLSIGAYTLENITLSIGVIPWPVVFITTDLINEYYGKAGVRKLTLLAGAMIAYCFGLLYLALQIPAWEHSPIPQEAFVAVFGQSMWIIVGSLVAFLVAQLVDVVIFIAFRRRTGKRLLWLRATGSTVVSQLVDSYVVAYIAFVLPGRMELGAVLKLSSANYAYKLLIAVAVTPVIYLAHAMIDRFLEGDEAAAAPAEP